MKKSLLTSLLIIQSLFLFAQNHTTTLGLKAIPSVSMVYNHPQQGSFASTPANSIGLEIRQQLNHSRFYVQSGIYSINRGFQYASGISNSFFSNVRHYANIQQYLSVPISIIYKRNGYFFGVGGNLNYYLNQEYYEDWILISAEKPTDAKNIIFGGQAFVGYDFTLGERLTLGVEVITNLTINPNLLNFGFGFCAKYGFGNGSK